MMRNVFLRYLAGGVLIGAFAMPLRASDINWDNPWGEATVLGSGPYITTLKTTAVSDGDVDSAFLSYTDSTELPARVGSAASSADGSAASSAQLSVEESQASGLYISGSVSASGAGPDVSGTATINLYLLLTPASDQSLIRLENLTTSVENASPESQFLSIEVFQSDSTGMITGDSLLTLSGDSSQQRGEDIAATVPYYLLRLSANADPSVATAVGFAFTLDFAAIPAVPEPDTYWLIAAGFLPYLSLRFLKRHRASAVNQISKRLLGLLHLLLDDSPVFKNLYHPLFSLP